MARRSYSFWLKIMEHLYKVFRLFFILFLIFLSSCKQEKVNDISSPVRVIFDTDIGPDVDDAGAVAVLHSLADNNEVKILGMVCNITSPWAAPCLDALNTYYGRPDILIGTLKGKGSSGDSPEWSGLTFTKAIAETFPNDLKSGTNAPDATYLYRKILNAEKDLEVVIISVGALTNLRNLIHSTPDSISSLTGVELVKRKVKLLSLMAGNYPKGIRQDPNFSADIEASIEVINRWPTPIVFSGEEIGKEIKTGTTLFQTKKNNPVRRAYLLWDSHFWPMWDSTFKAGQSVHSHDSYDQTSVLFACRGTKNYWKLSEPGINKVFANGLNEFQVRKAGKYSYLIESMSPDSLGKVIDKLMTSEPKITPTDR